MTLVQLRHLAALAQAASFSRAALLVHLTQPALSRSIRALEDELGQPLFDRIGRRVQLTPSGREVLAHAQRLVADADELLLGSRRLAQGEQGALRLGMGSGPGALLTTPLMLHAAQQAPHLQVQVSRANTELLVQRLRERELDALVVDLRSLKPAADLRVSEVHEMQGAFMVRRAHPLLRRRKLVHADLAPYPLATTPLSDEIARTLVELYGHAAHPEHAARLRGDEVAHLVQVAERSDTVLLAVRASAPNLVALELNPPFKAAARFGLVTLARRTEAPALARLRELMGQVLSEPVA